MFFQKLTGISFHERKFQSPPCDAQKGNPDEFLFQEKLEKGNTALEDMLKHQGVRPGTMITDDKVGTFGIKGSDPLNIPFDILRNPYNKTVAIDPPGGKENQQQKTLMPYPCMGDNYFY
jgi:hypothetical protein